MSYASTRRLVLGGGVAVLLLIAGILFLRRVDTVEVLAVLLFIPVFLAAIVWNLPGGVIAGALAAVAYAALRLDAIDAVGGGRFAGLITTRSIGYLAFGILGGWAVKQLEQSLEKLDIYDQIDDDTKLYNARFFLQETDLEMSRAQRYKTLFSVALVDVPGTAIDGLARRKRAAVLSDLGRALQEAIRSVDQGVHARVGELHRFAVICPETGPEGAAVFRSRLHEQVGAFLQGRGVDPSGLDSKAYTFPGDDHELARLRGEFERVEQEQHPEHPRPA
jgi:GGDEF domain-containing protein